MRCEWQVEIDPYARAVLAKHWPDVRRHEDVRTFPPPEGEWGVDVICGGFPCQDISVAGKGAGLAGARSGLWYEYARIIGELRPRYVIVENVAALLARGMGTVLGDLSTLGYDAEWHVIPASAVGAPHRRERVWIVGVRSRLGEETNAPRSHADGSGQSIDLQRNRDAKAREQASRRRNVDRSRQDVADAEGIGRRAGLCQDGAEQDGHQPCDGCCDVADADHAGRIKQRRAEPVSAEQLAAQCGGWWSVEPDVGRVAHGVPARVDRLRCLGNAVVPQIVEVIGRAIVEAA